MTEGISRLDGPIDVMRLMHKAFRALSERTEDLAAQGQAGGDLSAFRKSFDDWVGQLLYHAQTEDDYMTAPLKESQAARDNESEHDELRREGGALIEFLGQGDSAGLAENVNAAMIALEEQQHRELAESVEEVQDALKKALGEEKVLARTRRHLYRRAMAMRVLEYDHFENEEAFVISEVRERMDEQQQLAIARRLLIDDGAEDPRWIIDWVSSELDPGERKLLVELEAQWQRSPQEV
jgi:hypothetical protein